MQIDDLDRKIIRVLQENGRATTVEVAKFLGVSRGTVTQRIERLEHRGVITGYSVRLGKDFTGGQLLAHVMIRIDPKGAQTLVREIQKQARIEALYALSGKHDLLAIICAETTSDLDACLDYIGSLAGVEKTETSILLSTKFERGSISSGRLIS